MPDIQPTPITAEMLRRVAFTEEADPIFFKAQRGEATTEEWLAKVEEIRSRTFEPPY
jgi:hypothetical protein